MKRILFLSFYFEPDLSAGSFRNTSLAKKLAEDLAGRAEIEVFTTVPNRYSTFQLDTPLYEKKDNLTIHRIKISKHKSRFIDQILSFSIYFHNVRKKTRKNKYDLVYASSSRLFSAYLGHLIAKREKAPFYLDIRDIFYDSMKDLFNKNPLKLLILPVLKFVETRTFSNATHINLISKGFADYFRHIKETGFSFFTNGIDDEFLGIDSIPYDEKKRKIILYAGNIGEGQGLHKFIPTLAKNLERNYDFIIIGDGGAKEKLLISLEEKSCTNVYLKDPVSRTLLHKEYVNADFFLIHLNDYEAFKKVLPSKIFELASSDKPIIAGVGGYAADFIRDNVSNVILVQPCDAGACTEKILKLEYLRIKRTDFIEKFRRKRINEEMVISIISYLPNI